MSYVAQRAVLDTRTRVRDLSGLAPSLVTTTALSGLAVLVAVNWWQRGAALPASWTLPPLETLFLLPGAPVVGLLALRAMIGGRTRSVASQHLMTMASRWAAAWAAVTAVWLVATVAGLYGGGLTGLLGADNLVAVIASSDAATGQITLLWVALLVALFGGRLGSWREALGLLVLTTTALLAGAPVVASVAGHGHDAASTGRPLVLVLAALELVAVTVWLGALVAVPHLQTPVYQLRYNLTRFGDLVSAAALVVGVSAVVAGLLLPDRPTPLVLAIGQLAAVGLVATVGYRHRRRTVDVVTTGRGLLLAALVLGEVIVMAAVVMVGFLLPVGA
jgi:putative copper export protein